MKRLQFSALYVITIMSTFWAYTIIATLIQEYLKNVTLIDLGAIYIMGLIAGVALGLVYAVWRVETGAR